MKKFILLIFSIILISFLGVVVWMNLTPGYFQYRGCGCDEVGYYTDDEVLESRPNPTCRYVDVVCRPSFFNRILISLSGIDFNKGSLSGQVGETPPIPATENDISESNLGGKMYTSKKYGLSFEYPTEAKLENPSETTVKVTFLGSQNKKGAAFQLVDGYQLFVSTFEAGNETLASLTSRMYQNEKSVCVQGSEFSQITKTAFLNREAFTFNVSKCPNDESGIFVSNGKYIYTITQVIAGSTPDRIKYKGAADKILHSFRLLEVTEQGYSCPKTEWVNCMPILTPEAQKSCTKEYLDWAKGNCPGFKGAAY